MDIVIFGISGHLADTKIIPALVNLYHKGALPSDTHLFGFSRSAKEVEVPFPYRHIQGSYFEVSDVEVLIKELRTDKKQMVYLALPPDVAHGALKSLAAARCASIILIEKPFGSGYESAQHLIRDIKESFVEGQCLKVDHYAGKQLLHFSDQLSAACDVSLKDLEEIVIDILETVVVGERNGYYDAAGALRDVGQNHALFMLATFIATQLKKEQGCEVSRAEVLSWLVVDHARPFVFGSYEGYDKTETLFSVPARLTPQNIDHMRITIRSGKALAQGWAGFRIRTKQRDKNGEEKKIQLDKGVGAYEHIIVDALAGNTNSFLSDEEVLNAWKFIDTVEEIKRTTPHISYPQGSDIDDIV